jgi:hypothetical protein
VVWLSPSSSLSRRPPVPMIVAFEFFSKSTQNRLEAEEVVLLRIF